MLHKILWKSHPLQGCALKILREILSFTRSFMINTRLLVGCLENSDRKSETIPCYTSDCFKSSCLLFVNAIHLPNLNVSGSATRLPIYIAKLSRNRHCANRASGLARMAFKSSSVINLVYSYRASQTRFECSLLF